MFVKIWQVPPSAFQSLMSFQSFQFLLNRQWKKRSGRKGRNNKAIWHCKNLYFAAYYVSKDCFVKPVVMFCYRVEKRELKLIPGKILNLKSMPSLIAMVSYSMFSISNSFSTVNINYRYNVFVFLLKQQSFAEEVHSSWGVGMYFHCMNFFWL